MMMMLQMWSQRQGRFSRLFPNSSTIWVHQYKFCVKFLLQAEPVRVSKQAMQTGRRYIRHKSIKYGFCFCIPTVCGVNLRFSSPFQLRCFFCTLYSILRGTMVCLIRMGHLICAGICVLRRQGRVCVFSEGNQCDIVTDLNSGVQNFK